KVRLFRSLTAGRSFLMLLEDAATAGQVDALLPNSTGALVLVTSAARLPGAKARWGPHRHELKVERMDDAALADYFGRALEETRLEEEPDGALKRLARCGHGMPSLDRTAVSWLDGNPGRSIVDLIELLDRPGPEAAERSEEEVDDPVRAKFAALYRSLPEEAAGAYRALGAHPATGFDRWAVAAALGRSAERTRQALAELVRTGLVDLGSARRGRYEIAAVVHRHAAAEAGAELDAGDLRRVKRGYAAYLRRRRRRRGRAEHPPLDRAEEAGRRSGAAGAGRPGGGRAVAGGEHRRRPGLLGAGRGARRARPGDAVRRGLREPPSGEGALHRRRGADGAGDRGRGRRGSPGRRGAHPQPVRPHPPGTAFRRGSGQVDRAVHRGAATRGAGGGRPGPGRGAGVPGHRRAAQGRGREGAGVLRPGPAVQGGHAAAAGDGDPRPARRPLPGGPGAVRGGAGPVGAGVRGVPRPRAGERPGPGQRGEGPAGARARAARARADRRGRSRPRRGPGRLRRSGRPVLARPGAGGPRRPGAAPLRPGRREAARRGRRPLPRHRQPRRGRTARIEGRRELTGTFPDRPPR